MNYLKQIIAFDKWEELHPLSDKAYRLWFKLMAIANVSGWDEWLSVPLLKLKSELHTSSDQTIMNARNALVQAGRIEVRKGKHGKSADYHLIPLIESPSGGPSGDNHGVLSGEGSGGLNRVKSGEDGGAYYKQNKTKLNKTNKESKRDRQVPDPHATDRQQIVDYLNEKIHAHYRPNTLGTKKNIDGRLNEGFAVDDFKRVIDNKVADWGNDDKMAKFLRPETLFRPSKFESYLNQKAVVPREERRFT